MRRRVADLEHELDDLRRKQDALEAACSRLVAYEAAVQVILRHNLHTEWADEIARKATQKVGERA